MQHRFVLFFLVYFLLCCSHGAKTLCFEGESPGGKILESVKKCEKVTLPALQKIFVNMFFVFAWEFCIEKWRGFLVNFFWSPFPTKRSTKNPRKFGGNSEQNSGQNSGQKFEKFGELSFCNFSDLRKSVKKSFETILPFSSLTAVIVL